MNVIHEGGLGPNVNAMAEEGRSESAHFEIGGNGIPIANEEETEIPEASGIGGVPDDQSKKEASGAKRKQPTVPFLQLYSFADKFDYLLMFIGSCGAAVHGAALPIILLFLGKLLNGLGGFTDAQKRVDKYALYFVYIAVVTLFSSWIEVAFWMHTGQRQAAKLRERYLQALLHQDVAYFDTVTNTGDSVSSIASDPFIVQDAISEKTGNFIHYASTCIVSFIVGFNQAWRMAILTLGVLPAVAIPGAVCFMVITRIGIKDAAMQSEAGNIAQQAISQVRTVYSFVAEDKLVKAYSDALQKTQRVGVKLGLAKGVALAISYGITFCCYAVLITWAGILARKGQVQGGQLFGALLCIVVGTMAIGQSIPSLIAFSNGRVAIYKILQVIQHEPTINKPNASAEIPTSVQGYIELRDVDFSYPSRPDVPIFEKFSLYIPPGKSVAIVGSSGSGKSSIVSLIVRFYDATAGEILLDGHDLKKLDLKWLRKQIGLVNQEPALFATSIAANIAYGNELATQEDIEAAAKVANAHTFIDSFPLKYETQVGERGVQLSGGQRQRIAIARAIVKDPRILLLDEATSALDAGSEMVVQEALDRIMVGRTTVIVAHRLSTIRNADTIAVVLEGRIVERGTHQDLMTKENGAYFSLVRLQELAGANENRSLEDNSLNDRVPPQSMSRVGSKGSSRIARSFRESFSSHRSKVSSVNFTENEEPGYLLEEPGKSMEVSKGAFKRVIAMTKDDWMWGTVALFSSMGIGTLGPLNALLLGQSVADYFMKDFHKMKTDLLRTSLFYIGLAALAATLYMLQNVSLAIFGERLVKRVREKLLAKILQNELGWFDEDENNSSQIAVRLSGDAANVRAAVGERMSVIVQNIVLLLLTWTLALILLWRLGLVLITTTPLITMSFVSEFLFLKGFAGDQAKAYGRATRVAGEAVGNIRTVAAFSAEDKVLALFTHELIGPSSTSVLRGHIAGLGYGACQGVLYVVDALGMWYGGKLVVDGQATFGAVIKCFLVVVISGYAAAEAFTLAPEIVKGGQSVKAVIQLLDRVSKIEPNDSRSQKVEEIRGDIELKKVSFWYPSRPDVQVLKEMDLKVNYGESLALVGASGSGKSSIVALIERYYDPTVGEVRIDGVDIRNYNLKSLRQHIALVQQEPALFATSVMENILYGKATATEAEVIEAAKVANAHEFISSLPEGYKTQVGERGIQLSGGQKQRVAIARAVLKDPAIFLLDEATSALDAESEKVVQEAVDRLMRTRTTVLVAHRLSTIRGADSIAVVQEGRICEQGTHAALLSQGGAYSRLISIQNQA